MGATFPISAGLRRAFIGASEVAVSQPRFLLAFFGGFPNAMKSVETEYIESDLFKTKVRVAKFVNPDAVAKGTEKLTFVEQQIKLPTIKDKRSLTSKEMRSKGFGETIYDSSSNQTRVAAAMDTELVDMDSTIMNRLELMAIESIFDGRMTIVGEGENRIIDYSRKTGLSIVKNPKIITWDRVIFPSHKIAYTSGIIGTVTNGVNYSMKESANIYTTKALQSLKESYSMISDIEAMNGNVLTFNANEVNEFIKNESANLNFLKETLGIIKDSTFLCDGNKNVCVTLESGEKAIVPLEDHIFSAILDYCDK